MTLEALFHSSPTLYHDLIQACPDYLNIPENVTLVHHIVDVMLIRPDEQEAICTLDGLER